MNIGDRVRVLHGKEEGVIRKVSTGGRLEVEIEDGFVIPVMKSEVVLIAEAEKSYFGDSQTSSVDIEIPLPISAPKDQGLYLAFLPINDQNLSLYLINDSPKAYLSHASEVYGSNHRTLFAGTLGAGEVKKIDDRLLKELDEWPSFLLRFIPIQAKLEKAIPAFERQFKLKATQFFKHLSTAPLLGKKVYLFALEQTTRELDIRGLNAELNPNSSTPPPTKVQARQPPSTSISMQFTPSQTA